MDITYFRVNEIEDTTPDNFEGKEYQLHYQIFQKDKERSTDKSELLSDDIIRITATRSLLESLKEDDKDIEGTIGTLTINHISEITQGEENFRIPDSIAFSEENTPSNIPDVPLVKPGTELQINPSLSSVKDRINEPKKRMQA
jgi:hypothetical protein